MKQQLAISTWQLAKIKIKTKTKLNAKARVRVAKQLRSGQLPSGANMQRYPQPLPCIFCGMGINDKDDVGLIDSARFAGPRAQQVLAALEVRERELAIFSGNASCDSLLRQRIFHVLIAIPAGVGEDFYHYVLCIPFTRP